MTELTREVAIAARPETILSIPHRPRTPRSLMGTEADLEARPGGAYRVLVGGRHPSVGEPRPICR